MTGHQGHSHGPPPHDCHRTREVLETMLADRFGITHTTLQVDHRTYLIADARIPVGPGAKRERPGRQASRPNS